MAKRHQATEAGIRIIGSDGYEKKFPAPQWRQAMRTALNRYWSSGTGLAVEPTYLAIDIRDSRSNSMRFDFYPRDRYSEEYALIRTAGTFDVSGARTMRIDQRPGPDAVAAALSRFSWSRWYQALTVPVGWSERHSLSIPGGTVVLWIDLAGLSIHVERSI